MSQLFINIIGHNSSGKTTLARRLETDCGLNRVSGDDFRLFVHDNINYFKNTDISYPNEKYNQLNPLVLQYRFELTWVLLRASQHVIYDGSGSTKEIRTRYFDKVRQEFPHVTCVLIWTDIIESELLSRLQKRGKLWVNQYKDLKRVSFQPPENTEADIIIRYNQSNYDEVLRNIRDLLV